MTAHEPAGRPLRLVELLAPLSLVTDLGMGLPDEQAMRACLVATALARQVGLAEADVSHVYYTTLLEHLGCTATSREEGQRLAGDQLATRPLISRTDFVRPPEVFALLRAAGSGRAPLDRVRVLLGMLAGSRWGPGVQAAVCEVGARLAERLDMPPPVAEGLGQMFERWDGKGEPHHLRGEAIALPARFAQVASRAVALHALGGPEAAVEGVRQSSGGWLDPAIAGAFVEHGVRLLAEVDSADALAAMAAAEPEPRLEVSRAGLDRVAHAFADMVDLQSPSTLGHSTGVAALAEAAARLLGLPMADCLALRRAALLHDLGRVGVPSGIWEKRGPLTAGEWERVRLHPYYTERILARSPLLEDAASTAGMHHERLDGSGYHRGAAAREQPLAARILAAADSYQASMQERPHRPASSAAQAADRLAEEARTGRLDRDVVAALLDVAGEARNVAQPQAPAGLSEREVEVLRLIAAGHSDPAIAERLVISRRTAEHHVQHVYAKIGVSTRPGATLFALEHGLIPAAN